MRSGRSSSAAALIVAFSAFLVYAGTLRYPLLWDDPKLMQVAGEYVRDGGLAKLLTSEFLLEKNEPLGYYRPWILLSLWLDQILSRHFTPVFHATNVLVHSGASALVFFFLRAIRLRPAASLFGALIFAVHPVHTESVAFVSGRTDLWATAFLLVASIVWCKERSEATRISWPSRLAGLGSFALALLSKENSFLLPAVLLLWDLLEGRGSETRTAGWVKRNRFWLLGWAGTIAAVLFLRIGIANVGFGTGAAGADAPGLFRGPGISLPAATLATYLRLLVFPWPLKAFYTSSSVALTPLSIFASLALVGACVRLASGSCRRLGLFALVWMLGFLAPALQIVPIGAAAVAERFLYLPSVGLSVAIAAAIDRSEGRTARRWSGVLAGLVAAAFALLTVNRAAVWRGPLELYRDLAVTSPDYADGHYNLGVVYGREGLHRQAIEAYRRAVAADPGHYEALYNLGVEHAKLGEPRDAVVAYRRSLELKPDYVEAAVNLGIAYGALQRYDDAAAAFARAVSLRPDLADAHYNLGLAEVKRGRNAAALEAYRRALRLQPDMKDALVNLILLHRQLGQPWQAREYLLELRRLDPTLAKSLDPAAGR